MTTTTTTPTVTTAAIAHAVIAHLVKKKTCTFDALRSLKILDPHNTTDIKRLRQAVYQMTYDDRLLAVEENGRKIYSLGPKALAQRHTKRLLRDAQRAVDQAMLHAAIHNCSTAQPDRYDRINAPVYTQPIPGSYRPGAQDFLKVPSHGTQC